MNATATHIPVKLRPLCACGCGSRVRTSRARYLYGHVPHAIRAEGGRKGGLSRIYRRRRQQFEQVFEEMTRQGRVTKETLLDALASATRDGYSTGYRACEAKWKKRVAA